MSALRYVIIRNGRSWSVDQDGGVAGDYATKEAAFEAAVVAASNAIKNGHGVTVSVPEPERGESALGIVDDNPSSERRQSPHRQGVSGEAIKPQNTWRMRT